MASLAEKAAAFFEQDASEERKRILRENLAALPAGAPFGRVFLAQTPARFFDARLDAAPLFAEAEMKPAMISHLLGDLTRAWDVTVGADSLRVPIFLAHGATITWFPTFCGMGSPRRFPTRRYRFSSAADIIHFLRSRTASPGRGGLDGARTLRRSEANAAKRGEHMPRVKLRRGTRFAPSFLWQG